MKLLASPLVFDGRASVLDCGRVWGVLQQNQVLIFRYDPDALGTNLRVPIKPSMANPSMLMVDPASGAVASNPEAPVKAMLYAPDAELGSVHPVIAEPPPGPVGP